MSLRHAILDALLTADASGYELAAELDRSVSHYWHALPAQIYPELKRLEADGLVDSTDVAQDGRPNKREFAINDAGRRELRRWVQAPSPPFSLKDEFMVKVRAGTDTDPAAIIDGLHLRRERCASKLALYRSARAAMLRGRTASEYLDTARHIGPYLTANAGIALEEGQLAWIDESLGALQHRSAGSTTS